jgi:hypothetical protein
VFLLAVLVISVQPSTQTNLPSCIHVCDLGFVS